MTVLQEVHLGEEELLSWTCQVFKFWMLQCQVSILLRLLDPGDKHTAFSGNVTNYSTNNMQNNKEDLYFPQHYHQNVTLLMLGFTLTFSRKMKLEMTMMMMMMTAGMRTIIIIIVLIIICNIK
jgi:hypothetical protein